MRIEHTNHSTPTVSGRVKRLDDGTVTPEGRTFKLVFVVEGADMEPLYLPRYGRHLRFSGTRLEALNHTNRHSVWFGSVSWTLTLLEDAP